jgi:hypothetical protein
VFESSFSGSKFDLVEKISERSIKAIEGGLGARGARRLQRTGGPERPRIQARIEHGDLGAGGGDAVPMAARHPFDEAMPSQPSEVVGHRSRGVGVRVSSLELRDVIAELPMPEPGGGQRKETERVHERMDPAIPEPETLGPLLVDADGGRDGVELSFADQAVVPQRFAV